MRLLSAWRKEWMMQWTPAAAVMLALLWLLFGLYFLAGYQSYQALAADLAQLDNRRGATEMLLGAGNGVLLWMMVLWSVFWGARTLAQEYEWQTAAFYRAFWRRWLWVKAGALAAALLLLTLPFWFSVAWLSTAVHWDRGLLLGFFLAQTFIALYATGLALAVAAVLRHGMTAALLALLLWTAFWLLPLLINAPPLWADLVRWLSPFAHAELLSTGTLHSQTGVFALVMAAFWISLPAWAQGE